MRIVQIGLYPLSPDRIHGGVEASVYGLAQEQSRANEVHVFDFPRIGGERKEEKDGNVLVHRYCNKGKRQLQTIELVKQMANAICALSPDVCHIHGTNLFSWWMYKRLTQWKQKVVVTIHGLVCVEKRNRLKKSFSLKRVFQYLYQGSVEKRFLSHLPIAIVDTEYVKEKINAYPIHRKPTMFVIPQGINANYFGISCSPDSRVVLSVGAIGERKGHLLTLKSFERVREAGIEARLMIVGSIADQTYFQLLQKAIEESTFSNDVTLYVDLPEKDLMALYRGSHLFALHTEEESQGIVFAEAMATGMPVVSTRVGGVPYVVIEGVNGLLVQNGDVEGFANHIALMLKDDAKWKLFSESAVQLSNNYHWSVISNRIDGVYSYYQ